MHLRTSLLLLIALLAAGRPVSAQVPDWVADILVAARLPIVADSVRRDGAPKDDVRALLEAMARARVPAHEATALLDTTRAVHREHVPMDNFGAFVQSQLAEGKRGRELAAAIRAEHVRQGKGNAGRKRQGAAGADDSVERDSAGRGRGRDKARPADRSDSIHAQGDSNRGQGRGRPSRPDR